MANQPDIIPSAWAANNSTTETIPATTTESGKASWDQGFPVETSLPLSQGGIPPKYGDFNGVLNILSQFCLFAQSGGQYAWVNSLDYSVGSIVLGTDGSIYRAAQVSGPSTAAVNPVGDTSGKWERIVSQSDINALEQEISDAMDAASDAASNASAAQSAVTTLDANVVKLSGDQTISGAKTFTRPIVRDSTSAAPTIKTASSNDSGAICIWGANSALTAGASLILYGDSYSTAANKGQFILYTGTNGTTRKGLAGSPGGALTWGGDDVIIASGDQEVAGQKTFTSTPVSKGSSAQYFIQDTSVTRTAAPSSQAIDAFTASDKNKEMLASLQMISNTDGSRRIRFRIIDTSTNIHDIVYDYGTYTYPSFFPGGNNGYTLGNGDYRWRQLYAKTSTISTSDERNKTSIDDVPDAVLDAWGEVRWQQFQFIDAVEEKGENARLHNGLIAQRIDEVFKAHGLDASRYGLFCWDSWEATPEERDEQGNITQEARPAGDVYSLRYEEALAMEAAYQRRRADRAEARITSLEQRLGELEAVLATLIAPVGDETYAEPEQEGEGADA